IILMGLKVQTSFFHAVELLLIGGVAFVALPSTFFVAHALSTAMGVRRPMGDLVAGGTMICGASAVNAIAPVAKAHREEQGVAIAVIFLFSIVALMVFRPIAQAIGLDSSFAGLWSGLAVNDLSSAIAVGSQMGGTGGVMATTAKSARILLLAPTLVTLSFMRRESGPISVKKSIVDALPRFLLGYIGLAILRFVGDRYFGASSVRWRHVLEVDKFLVDLTMVTVSAGIGLHLGLRTLISSSPRATVVGGGTSLWMASLTLAMIVAVARGATSVAIVIGVVALASSFAAYRASTRAEVREGLLVKRFETGAPLSLGEATQLLDLKEREGAFADAFLKRLLVQLHPTIGELIPIRESPLPHGEGCRWMTYWEGKNGWALVALCREPGATTPIHAHPHRLVGKTIEGVIEELRFNEVRTGEVELASRVVLGHEELVESDALASIHVLRTVGRKSAIDLQLRGPEVGVPGRVLRTATPVDFSSLAVGTNLLVSEEADARPGHGGEGAAAGRVVAA
ncbi:MAG: putative sulfate exporter family transporter, partial [Polyangiales bacterium]